MDVLHHNSPCYDVIKGIKIPFLMGRRLEAQRELMDKTKEARRDGLHHKGSPSKAHVSLVCGSEFLYGFKDRNWIVRQWSRRQVGMAMELHCASNLLATFLGTYDYTESMDRFLEQYDRKFIRKVMLKHEEIFKQQVHELHRLYRVQKMLMAEMDMKLKSLPNTATTTAVTDSRTRFGSSTSTSETSQSSNVSLRHHPTAQLNSNYSALPRCTMMLPSSQEAENPLRTLKSFNLELSAEEDPDLGVGTTQDKTSLLQKHLKQTMSNKGRDTWTDGEIDVELTLSIGSGFSEKKPRQWLDPNIGLGYSKSTSTENRKMLLSTPVKPERGEECSDPTAGFDRESLQRPSWLLQALSLNRT